MFPSFSQAWNWLWTGHANYPPEPPKIPEPPAPLEQILSINYLSVLKISSGDFKYCAFSPNQRELAIITSSVELTQVSVWNIHTGICRLVIPLKTNRVSWSHDGRFLALDNINKIIFYDAQTGQQAFLLEYSDKIVSWTLSLSGPFIAIGIFNKKTILENFITGETQVISSTVAVSCAFSRDQSHLAITTELNQIEICCLRRCEKIQTFLGPGYPKLVNYAWSPNGNDLLLTIHEDCTARLWNIGKGGNYQTIFFAEGAVAACGFDNHRTPLVSVRRNLGHKIEIWDIAKKRCLLTLPEEHRKILHCRFNLFSNLLLTISEARVVKIWEFSV